MKTVFAFVSALLLVSAGSVQSAELVLGERQFYRTIDDSVQIFTYDAEEKISVEKCQASLADLKQRLNAFNLAYVVVTNTCKSGGRVLNSTQYKTEGLVHIIK